MQPDQPRKLTEAEVEAGTKALAAWLRLPPDDPAVRDFVQWVEWMVDNERWASLPLVFQQGKLIGVGPMTYQRGRGRE